MRITETAAPHRAGAVRAVLLDAAGTLIRPARPVGETYAAAAADHGTEIAPAALGAAFRAVFPRMPPMTCPEAGAADLDAHERAWWRRLVGEVLDHCGAPVAAFDPFFDDLYARFAEPAAWALYPEVDAALARLRAAGLKLAIVSNFDSRLEVIAGGLGLAARVDCIVYSTRAGHAKPDPRIFVEALGRLGVAAGEAVHVGDSAVADYHGARAAGLRAWLLARGEGAGGGAPSVPDLATFAARVLDGTPDGHGV